ncbi:membrane protein required for colicin V production [Comamonas sp. BIGb0124]|uniref:CvpA family protein n=1 Tax=Comamonas sp. BIGb0124 TaxID=2485130 RepID=UPI000F473D35|nr:CvpA family protein [Comamonas sp. BIGb0124]ROR22763.1 membrane protein required for colicin V production [Comamonas sp. BIGb0124]
MAALDWIALAVVVASSLVGAWRGLIFEVLSLAGWVLAFVAAYWWATDLAALLPMGDSSAAWRLAAAFVLIFLGVVFVVSLLASLLRKLFTAIGLRPLDRALGAVFGVARAGLLLLALAVAVRLLGLGQEDWWQSARSAAWLEQALVQLEPWMPQAFSDFLKPDDETAPGLLPRDGRQPERPVLRLPV